MSHQKFNHARVAFLLIMIRYMRLKRNLLETFPREVVERNQSVLQKILQSHECRMQVIAARRQGPADFKFDDVVLYEDH